MTAKFGKFPRSARAGRQQRGATLIEFAFVVPILILLMMGILEFGWYIKNQLQVANAVRDGARDAAVGLTTGQIRQRIINRAAGVPGVPDNMTLEMHYDSGSGPNYTYPNTLGNDGATNDAPSGALIRVRATIPATSLTGVPILVNKTWLTTVIMRREPPPPVT